MNNLKIIGSEEWCSFESFKIPAIKARIDSGAKTSSIQASNIKIFLKQTQEWVRFEVTPLQENKSISISCEAKIHSKRTVKNYDFNRLKVVGWLVRKAVLCIEIY